LIIDMNANWKTDEKSKREEDALVNFPSPGMIQ